MAAVAAIILVVLVIVLAALVAAQGAARIHGGAALQHAKWEGPSRCYPTRMAERCLRAVSKAAGSSFGPADASEKATLAREASALSREFGVPLAAWQLEAMRDMEVALRASHAGVRAQQYGEEIAREHAAGDPVLAIAARHHLAPMAALRQLLVEGGRSESEVRALIANPSQLPPRLAAEAPAIFAADLGSRLHADRKRAEAQAFEDRVKAHLAGQGLVFQTEDDLRRAFVARPGALPLFTPDFVFEPPVKIGGRHVAWLDAKNYPLYGSRLVAKSLAKQAEKYTARFGPGAMVFSGGLMCGVEVFARAPPLLLDGSHLAAAN